MDKGFEICFEKFQDSNQRLQIAIDQKPFTDVTRDAYFNDLSLLLNFVGRP